MQVRHRGEDGLQRDREGELEAQENFFRPQDPGAAAKRKEIFLHPAPEGRGRVPPEAAQLPRVSSKVKGINLTAGEQEQKLVAK